MKWFIVFALGVLAIMFAAPLLSPSTVELISVEIEETDEEPHAFAVAARDLGDFGRTRSAYFVRDPETGCEYVMTYQGHITPRLGADRRPLCR